jgi:hypothetical protein
MNKRKKKKETRKKKKEKRKEKIGSPISCYKTREMEYHFFVLHFTGHTFHRTQAAASNPTWPLTQSRGSGLW